MSPLEAALAELSQELRSAGVPHMLIGALAMACWEEPRATLDVDVSLWAEPAQRAAVARGLLARFKSPAPDPLPFLDHTNVLPLVIRDEIRADVVFATLPFERDMIARARVRDLGGVPVPVATVEDLILMKLISERPQDQDDAARLLKRHGRFLDHAYLAPLLEELAAALDRPAILAAYRAAK